MVDTGGQVKKRTVFQIQDLCRRDTEALDLLDRVTTAQHGGDRSKRDNVTLAESDGRGNANTYALRKLRKDRPVKDSNRILCGDTLRAHARGEGVARL